MENTQKDESYSTRDMYEATALITLRFYMINIDYQLEGDKLVGYFQFENSSEVKEASNKFFQGQLSVEPRQFISNWKALKAQTNNVYKNPKTDLSKYPRKENKTVDK